MGARRFGDPAPAFGRGAVAPRNEELINSGISPSRVKALMALTNGLPSDELYMLLMILTEPMSVDSLVRLADRGFCMIGGRFENHCGRLLTSSVLLIQKGAVRTHLSPMLVDYGAESEQQRTSVTGAFHLGNEFVDPMGVKEIPHFFPWAYQVRASLSLSLSLSSMRARCPPDRV